VLNKVTKKNQNDRSQREWELIIYRLRLIRKNKDLLEKSLQQKKTGLIEDAKEVVTKNQTHPYLQCEAHTIAIRTIQDVIDRGLLPRKQMKEEEDEHWKALGTLLADKTTFGDWHNVDDWAELVWEAMNAMNEKEKAKDIRENIDRNKPESETELEDFSMIRKPTRAHANLKSSALTPNSALFLRT
jgi:hypothetical protein